jgi:hypothetical protein
MSRSVGSNVLESLIEGNDQTKAAVQGVEQSLQVGPSSTSSSGDAGDKAARPGADARKEHLPTHEGFEVTAVNGDRRLGNRRHSFDKKIENCMQGGRGHAASELEALISVLIELGNQAEASPTRHQVAGESLLVSANRLPTFRPHLSQLGISERLALREAALCSIRCNPPGPMPGSTAGVPVASAHQAPCRDGSVDADAGPLGNGRLTGPSYKCRKFDPFVLFEVFRSTDLTYAIQVTAAASVRTRILSTPRWLPTTGRQPNRVTARAT